MSHRRTTQQYSANYDPEELRRYMVSQPDERLLEIVTQERAQYVQPALNLAEAELRLRGVPFTVPPPPAPVVPTGPKLVKRVWLGLGYAITYAVLTLSGFFGHYLYWLFSKFGWFCKMVIGGAVAFCVVRALFWTAEHLLAYLRRVRYP